MSEHASVILVIAPPGAQERLLNRLRPLRLRLTVAHDIVEARQALERSVVLGTFFVAPGETYEGDDWPETLRSLANRWHRLHVVVTTPITGEWVLPIVLRRQAEAEPSPKQEKTKRSVIAKGVSRNTDGCLGSEAPAPDQSS